MLFRYLTAGNAAAARAVGDGDGMYNDPEVMFLRLGQFLDIRRGVHDRVAVVELQPGDGSVYMACLSFSARLRKLVVSMVRPRFVVAELDVDGPMPTVYDEPMCDANPFTGAIMADLVAAAWQSPDLAYDYKRSLPKSITGLPGVTTIN